MNVLFRLIEHFIKKAMIRVTNIAFHYRLFFLLLGSVAVVLTLQERYLNYSFQHYQFSQIELIAMNQAKIIASMDSVIQSVERRDKEKLAGIMRHLRQQTDFSYVVIADEHFKRLYHPDQNKIEDRLQSAKPNPDIKQSYVEINQGSIGTALLARTPIINAQGQVIGTVSLGYLLSKIDHLRLLYSVPLVIFLLLLLVIAAIAAWWFSLHIKQQMYGLEPAEIARVREQQEALLCAVYEGIIAIDLKGNITAINQNARKMLNISVPDRALIDKPVENFITPAAFLIEKDGEDKQNTICRLNDLEIIANRSAINIGGQFQGWVISFRSKNDIHTLSAELTQIQQYVDNLRTVQHEHLNWMSTLSGLLQMQEYERALSMVKMASIQQQTTIDQLRNKFQLKMIAALLFGKSYRAKELGLELLFMEGSGLKALEVNLTESELAAIIGNLIDNAFEATLKNPASDKRIEFLLYESNTEIILEVADTGCGIDEQLKDRLFERGVTNKNSKNHGIGLYLVATYLNQCQGKITIEDNLPYGTIFTLFIPKCRSPS